MSSRQVSGVLLALLCAGCVTNDYELSNYTRDGVQYGVTQGPFQGRWWHHYERGCSFLDGEYYAEAETEFRTALKMRSTDQLWPRTYGLHFTPEYFPHRELGIARYHQGQLEDATRSLERSMAQQTSARAAYWLGKARSASIQSSGADTEAPAIEITNPTSSMPLGAGVTTVTGIARDDTFVAGIWVNDEPCPVLVTAPEVAFSHPVTLAPMQNDIRVRVEDLTGKSSITRIQIESDVDGPVVSFDRPLVVPGILQGVVFDPAGVARLSIGAATVDLDVQPDGHATFSMKLKREELLDGPVTYLSEDMLGNRTQGRLPVDTLLTSALPSGIVSAATQQNIVLASNQPVIVPISAHLNALMVGGQILAVRVIPSATEGPRIRFTNLHDGLQFAREEIAVALDVEADAFIEGVQLDGIDLTILKNRKVQTLSRRLRLEPGTKEIIVVVRDVAGNMNTATISVERVLSAVESVEQRLSLALMDHIWNGRSPRFGGEVQVIMYELAGELHRSNRFNVLDREIIEDVLAEKALTAVLGGETSRGTLCRVIPADLLIVGSVRRDAESIAIVLEAVSTETSEFVSYVDVAGAVEDLDSVKRLVRDLAARIVQEFPRVQGQVDALKGADMFITSMGEKQGIRRGMKYIVYRETNTEDGWGDTEILTEARVNKLKKEQSLAEVVAAENNGDETTIKVGDHVITK